MTDKIRCDWCDKEFPASYVSPVGDNHFCVDCMREFPNNSPLIKGDTDRPGCGALIVFGLFVIVAVIVAVVLL